MGGAPAADEGTRDPWQRAEHPCDKLITWNGFAVNAMRCWPKPRKRIGALPVEAR